MKYQKKPVVVEAIQMPTNYDTAAVREVALWMVDLGYDANPDGEDLRTWDDEFVIDNGDLIGLPEHGSNYLFILTLEGEMRASPGDWVIRGVKGEFYPCRADIFDATYERAAS